MTMKRKDWENNSPGQSKILLTVATVFGLFSPAIAFAADYDSTFTDTDNNGIDDRVEAFITGSDVNTSGSVARSSQVYLSSEVTSGSPNVIPLLVGPKDYSDSDGISDFLEVYGYYVDGTSLAGLKRVVPTVDWDNFKLRDTVDGYDVYKWAAKAIERSGLITEGDDSTTLILNIADAYDSIYQKFKDKRVPETHNFFNGSASEIGTIASIMAEFAIKYDPKLTLTDGSAIRAYYTDPFLISSDRDPYSDYDEVMGTSDAGLPYPPADDPLIAGIPNITTHISSFTLTDIVENRETDGTTATHTDVYRTTKSQSRSNGIAVSASGEKEVSASPSWTWKVGFTQSNSWTTAKSIVTEDRDAFAVSEKFTVVTAEHCYSKLKMELEVGNNGSDKATAIYPKWYITLGDDLWKTLYGSKYMGSGAALSAGDVTRTTVLGQGDGDEACLTLDQTNYLNGGGAIGVITELESAKVSYLDEASGVIKSDSDWNNYKQNYEQYLAKVELDIFTTENTAINKTLWVRAVEDDERLPSMAQTLHDVLARAYKEISCSTAGDESATLCFETNSDGYIVLGNQTKFSVSMYNEDGTALDTEDTNAKNEELIGDADSEFEVSLAPRMTITIIDQAAREPEIDNVEIISSVSGSGASQGIEVRVVASDYFGLDTVYFCTSDDDCRPMAAGIDGQADSPTSGYYIIDIDNYTLAGTEYIKAVNVVNNINIRSPESFYLKVIDSLYNQISEFESNLKDIDTWLSYIYDVDGSVVYEINNYNLMESPHSASEKYEVLSKNMTALKEACAYTNPESVGSASALLTKYQECVTEINKYKTGVVEQNVNFFNPYKLPLKNNLVAHGQKVANSSSGNIEGETQCDFGEYDIITGMGIGYSNKHKKPMMTYFYRTLERTGFVEPLFDFSSLKSKNCGGSVVEKSWYEQKDEIQDGNSTLNALVDFGWSVKKRNVNKLCVIYREFDSKTATFKGEYHESCNGNWGGIERFSNNDAHKINGSLGVASASLNDVGVFAKFTTAQQTSARHYTYEYDYQSIPPNGLISGQEYRIRSSSTGRYLGITGTDLDGREILLKEKTDSEDQIWIVEAINDREFRLIPKSFEGYLTRPDVAGDTGDQMSVLAEEESDTTTVTYGPHWRLARVSGESYTIASVVSLRSLSESTLSLAETDGTDDQTWVFEAIDPENVVPVSGTLNSVTHESQEVGQSALDTPLVFVDMQTFNGIDPAQTKVVADDTDVGSFSISVAEETSGDAETGHGAEMVAYMFFDAGDITDIAGTVIGETGKLTISYDGSIDWHQLTFNNIYTDPVVLMRRNTDNAGKPIHIRLNDVNEYGVEYMLERWSDDDIVEADETIVYLVIESGLHLFPNGKTLQASNVMTDQEWITADFAEAFSYVPAVLTQSQTYNGSHSVVTRNKSVATDSFTVRIQEGEGYDGTHAKEKIGVIAVGL